MIKTIYTISTDCFASRDDRDSAYCHQFTYFAKVRGEVFFETETLADIRNYVVDAMNKDGISPAFANLCPDWVDRYMERKGWFIGEYLHAC